jgi:hypothetical protein
MPDFNFIKGNGDRGKALFFWKVDCDEDKYSCIRHKGYSCKPAYIILLLTAEIGKIKAEFESGNNEIEVFKTNRAHRFIAPNKKDLDSLISNISKEGSYDIIDAGTTVDCSMVDSNTPGRSVINLFDKYGELYFKRRKGFIQPKILNLLNDINLEKNKYESMSMDEKLSFLTNLTEKVFQKGAKEKEVEFARGEIERLVSTFDKKYSMNEYVHAVHMDSPESRELCSLYLKRYFHLNNDSFEMLANVESQIKEKKARLKEKKQDD